MKKTGKTVAKYMQCSQYEIKLSHSLLLQVFLHCVFEQKLGTVAISTFTVTVLYEG